ncbi:MAG: VWA domain-containing protein [Thermoanaerobaculales bacterium]
MRTRLKWLIALSFVAFLATRPAPAVKVSQLPTEWRKWLEEEVYPLITDDQRKAFLALESDAERKEFVERLWQVWGAQNGLGSAFRRNYQERLELCRSDFGNTREDRARLLLIHGSADNRKVVNCEGMFNPLEIWFWARIEGLGENVVVVFYKPYGLGNFKLWDAMLEGRDVLYEYGGWQSVQSWLTSSSASVYGVMSRPETRCADGVDVLRWLDIAEYWMKDLTGHHAMEHVLPPPEGGPGGKESATAHFLEFSTLLPKGAKPVNFTVSASVGARRGSKMAVTFAANVPREGLSSNKVGDLEVVQLDVTGEVAREGEMADRFRYAFTFPASASEFPVVVERELHPGHYKLRLKVQDSNSAHAATRDLEFEVTAPVLAAEPPVDKAAEQAIAKVAAAQEAVIVLHGPEGEGISGVQHFGAMVGPTVARVEFFLDNRPVMTKNRPPFEVDLDLGPVPRLATVEATAFDAAGKELDRKKLDLNVGRERFFVRLQPVTGADRKGAKVHAVVNLNVPTDRKLERVELYWNELKVETLYQSPFEAWLPVKDDGSIGYLRALAVLSDDSEAEDVQFVNAPQFLTGVQVRTVELPVTVLDSGARPVEGLELANFNVSEDGVKQTVSHFALQQELPIRLGVVIDTSGSMEKTLPEVQRVVIGFLRNLVRPRDRAFVVAFSDRPAMLASFTADFGALERALIALKAANETALYDSVVYSLFQFAGVRGRKAMVILTDGEDNASKMDFDRTLDYAKRSGVVIYTIGIDLPLTKVGIRSQLSRLARTTGGEGFFLPREANLEPVYERINRELRTQYLLTYTSSSEAALDVFRKVAVTVNRPKVEVRTIAGYYPGG